MRCIACSLVSYIELEHCPLVVKQSTEPISCNLGLLLRFLCRSFGCFSSFEFVRKAPLRTDRSECTGKVSNSTRSATWDPFSTHPQTAFLHHHRETRNLSARTHLVFLLFPSNKCCRASVICPQGYAFFYGTSKPMHQQH
jgi:hypothetical protein